MAIKQLNDEQVRDWTLQQKDPTSRANKILVENQEPICAGLIAGGALMGIAVILLESFVIGP